MCDINSAMRDGMSRAAVAPTSAVDAAGGGNSVQGVLTQLVKVVEALAQALSGAGTLGGGSRDLQRRSDIDDQAGHGVDQLDGAAPPYAPQADVEIAPVTAENTERSETTSEAAAAPTPPPATDALPQRRSRVGGGDGADASPRPRRAGGAGPQAPTPPRRRTSKPETGIIPETPKQARQSKLMQQSVADLKAYTADFVARANAAGSANPAHLS